MWRTGTGCVNSPQHFRQDRSPKKMQQVVSINSNYSAEVQLPTLVGKQAMLGSNWSAKRKPIIFVLDLCMVDTFSSIRDEANVCHFLLHSCLPYRPFCYAILEWQGMAISAYATSSQPLNGIHGYTHKTATRPHILPVLYQIHLFSPSTIE